MCCSLTWHCRTCQEPCSAGVCEPAHRSPRYWPITSYPLDIYETEAAEAGAQGIIAKDDFKMLAQAIAIVHNGDVLPANTPFETAENAYDRIRSTPADPLTTLTFNEMKALNLASHGLSSKEIAKQMKVTPVTVRTYTLHARTKLGAATLGEALVKWQRAKHV